MLLEKTSIHFLARVSDIGGIGEDLRCFGFTGQYLSDTLKIIRKSFEEIH